MENISDLQVHLVLLALSILTDTSLVSVRVMCHGDILNPHCRQHSIIQQMRWEDKHFESIASWGGVCARTCAHFLIAAVNCFKAVVMMMSYHNPLIS